ncbi:aspartic proteinase CDR1-like isoform X1 [Lycium barbarum]|uniref:aspartic proteinase CDR1-like isoform X1 n=1 Tax=Lycium barbarum TaxID=112863 RepID=UPI00293F4975|nr:aspartic proteinase CDR1-like isoform X1 [Lycium barbarum]
MGINTKAFTLINTFVFLAFFHLSLVSCQKITTNRRGNDFTLDLIHRDSPLSPCYNPSNSPFERLQNAFRRSFSRASFFKKKLDALQSTIAPMRGEYFTKISIGTPPIDMLAIVDTGSDLTWTQCEPCVTCFRQLVPIFYPYNSSTYRTVGCNDKACQEIRPSTTTCKSNICNYEQTYEDQTYSIGDLSIETFTFTSTSGENIYVPNIVFGCGHVNNETSFNNYTSGMMGLGGGRVSIVNQMNQEIKGKFSYCLIPLLDSSPTNSNATSHIYFGDSADVYGLDVVSTPLIQKQQNSFYYLNLEGISVRNKTLEFKSSIVNACDEGNIIIDSGTMLTYLPNDFYSVLEKTLVVSINATRKDDPFGIFNVCYQSENGTIDAPKIAVHFTNADVELSAMNTFIEVEEGLICFTMVPDEETAILGNLAQMNFVIGYDLVASKVHFLPTDCTKY